jgi:DNA polymerase-3 subunit gamma/tau
MTYQVLARKWRPKTFSQVVGQEHIVKTLQNAIKADKLAHAYLLAGTRGVGKTSMARIFGKSLLCHNLGEDLNPCLKCSSCLSIDDNSSMDYLEIDGASNNGVDHIRQLVENVQYLPTSGRYKVYVIDEVHMLSTSAFNALLKTLEEPPAHVKFIFATTNPDKLLGTVLSRCQRFDFKNLTEHEIAQHLGLIANSEKIGIGDVSVLTNLAKLAKGSLRDALSLFDQVLSLAGQQELSEQQLTEALGIANTEALTMILSSMLDGSISELKDTYWQLLNRNIDIKFFSSQIVDEVFNLIHNIDNEPSEASANNSVSFKLAPVIKQMPVSELFWIYYSLVKDIEWALGTNNSEQNVLVSLLKICLRKQILGHSSNVVKVEELKKKNNLVSQTANLTSQDSSKSPASLSSITIESLIDFVKKFDMPLASNLEHTNIIVQPEWTNDKILKLCLGVSEHSKVSFEYLNAKDVFNQLKIYISDCLQIELSQLDVSFRLLTHDEVQRRGFLSKFELDQKKIKQEELKIVDEFLANPYIRQLEETFGLKPDNISINDKVRRK